MNRLPVRERAQILHALCEGMSMRSCERVFQKPFKTIKRIVTEVGDMALDFHRRAEPVPSKLIQADEVWSFIGENDYGSAKKPEARGKHGVSWTWLAIDKDTKLVLTFHVGTRQGTDATIFLRQLAARLRRDDHGNFVVKPTLAVDGHRAYVDAIELAFGQEINAGKLEKIYTKYDANGEPLPGSRYKGSRKERIVGDPDLSEITTWRIERENGFLRQANGRFGRKRNSFSKSYEFHERQLAIWMFYRNYCWQPYPVRPREGSKQWEKCVTAAMAANLTDHIWDTDELITASDEYHASRSRSAVVSVMPDHAAALEAAEYPFWVSYSVDHKRAKVHSAACTSCNSGTGKKGGTAQRGTWRGFHTLEDAASFASSVLPDYHSVCRLCLGSYNTLWSYGPRR